MEQISRKATRREVTENQNYLVNINTVMPAVKSEPRRVRPCRRHGHVVQMVVQFSLFLTFLHNAFHHVLVATMTISAENSDSHRPEIEMSLYSTSLECRSLDDSDEGFGVRENVAGNRVNRVSGPVPGYYSVYSQAGNRRLPNVKVVKTIYHDGKSDKEVVGSAQTVEGSAFSGWRVKKQPPRFEEDTSFAAAVSCERVEETEY